MVARNCVILFLVLPLVYLDKDFAPNSNQYGRTSEINYSIRKGCLNRFSCSA
jgi:hypothetical protein